MQPFPVFDKIPIQITDGHGVYVYDADGNEYLDLYGGHAVISIGHGHPTFTAAVAKQLHRLPFYSNVVVNMLQEDLAKLIGAQSGYTDYQVFFSNSGAEANENAIKLASMYTGRSKVLSFANAFHGRTAAAVAATDIAALRAPVHASDRFVFCPLNDCSVVRKQLETAAFCAVIIEGIQGVAGIHVPDPVFLRELEAVCAETGTLLILDEIQSGYGRTGYFFAHQHAGICPDLITIAKGMGNGFPIAGTLIHPKIKAQTGQLGSTFGGNHLACAAGIAVLNVLKGERLIENAGRVGAYLKERLSTIAGVLEVRGMGLMIGVEFEHAIESLRADLLFEEGVFTGYAGMYTLRLLPPLSLTPVQVDSFIAKLEAVICKNMVNK